MRVERYREILHMFSILTPRYREHVIRNWRMYLNNRLSIILGSVEQKVSLAEDPHEARFLADGPADAASVPSPEKSEYVTLYSRNFHNSLIITTKQGKKHLGCGGYSRIDCAGRVVVWGEYIQAISFLFGLSHLI